MLQQLPWFCSLCTEARGIRFDIETITWQVKLCTVTRDQVTHIAQCSVDKSRTHSNIGQKVTVT